MPTRESRYFLIGLVTIFFVLLFFVISGFFAPFIIGTILAALTYPFYQFLLRKFHEGKNISALVTVLLVLLLIILPLFGLLILLGNEALSLLSDTSQLSKLFDPFISTVQPIATQFHFDIRNFIDTELEPTLKNLGLTLSKEVGGIISNAVSLILNFFVMAMTLFYLLRDGEKFSKFLIDLSPLKTKEELNLYKTFHDAGKAIFVGNFVAAMVQGLLGGIGFAIFGIPSPVLWGAVMGFLALIPFLGPYIIFLPAGVYLFATGSLTMGIIFFIYNIFIVSTIDNFIKPILIGDKISIHPLLVLLTILGGIEAFGLMGIIYGPLIAAMFLAILKVYLKHEKVMERIS